MVEIIELGQADYALQLQTPSVPAPRAEIGAKVDPTDYGYTVAMPWYDRDDFQHLWELAHDKSNMPADYDVWHAAAMEVVNAWLARGKALQIVTIKPDAFLAWLEARLAQHRGYPAEIRRGESDASRQRNERRGHSVRPEISRAGLGVAVVRVQSGQR